MHMPEKSLKFVPALGPPLAAAKAAPLSSDVIRERSLGKT